VWLVLDYAGVERALTDHAHFSSNVSPSRNVRFEWLLFMDPPRHSRLRSLVAHAFTPRSIAALEPRIRTIARELLDAAGDAFDVVADFAGRLPVRVIAELLGVADAARFPAWSAAIVGLGDTIVGDAAAARAASDAFATADDEMGAFFTPLLATRRAHPADDLLARLATAEVDGERLDDDEILRFVQLLLAAGTETTTDLVSNALLSLDEHRNEWAKLRADLSLLPRAIEEVLRYRSPAQIVFRATRADLELGGVRVPAGKMVLVVVGAANRDPAVFAAPDRFDILREPNPHLAFGRGLHFCIGAPLSRLEGRVALAELFVRARDFTLPSTQPWLPRPGFHVHGPRSLPIRLM
jgi:cytochrome P450